MPNIFSFARELDHVKSLNNHLKEKDFPSEIIPLSDHHSDSIKNIIQLNEKYLPVG